MSMTGDDVRRRLLTTLVVGSLGLGTLAGCGDDESAGAETAGGGP